MASVFILTNKSSGQLAVPQGFDTKATATQFADTQGITAISTVGELPVLTGADITENIRRNALSKLTSAEKVVLGLVDAPPVVQS